MKTAIQEAIEKIKSWEKTALENAANYTGNAHSIGSSIYKAIAGGYKQCIELLETKERTEKQQIIDAANREGLTNYKTGEIGKSYYNQKFQND